MKAISFCDAGFNGCCLGVGRDDVDIASAVDGGEGPGEGNGGLSLRLKSMSVIAQLTSGQSSSHWISGVDVQLLPSCGGCDAIVAFSAFDGLFMIGRFRQVIFRGKFAAPF